MIPVPPPPLSTQSLADLLATLIVLCRGKDRFGKDFWAYLCIKPSMAEAFAQARDGGSFILSDYGTILESGDGSEVPDEVKSRMARDYAVKDDFEAQLIAAIHKRKASA